MDMDYGHAKYLESLQGQKGTITSALERLEHRTAEVLYKHEQWFRWVRERQSDEEKNREKEQKKVKMEAALFKRHWKSAQQRLKESKAKEDRKRQDAYLEKVYKKRMAGQDTEDSEMDWDPIEDVLEDSRGSFVDLIQHFLWIAISEPVEEGNDEDVEMANAPIEKANAEIEKANAPIEKVPLATEVEQTPKKSKKSKSRAKKKADGANTPSTPQNQQTKEKLPDKGLIESRKEMHDRLKHGSEFNRDKVEGVMIGGTIERPIIDTKTATLPEDEIEQLLTEVHEIKYLLFCRLLLSYASLLPAALRANSVEEFLADDEVSTSALRDICLKLERPSLQEIRDACADLFRSEEEVEEVINVSAKKDGDTNSDIRDKRLFLPKKEAGALPDKWVPKSQRVKKNAVASLEGAGTGAIDFGPIHGQERLRRERVRVKVCGRQIWNYPNNRAMNRGGWLQFCVLAKNSRLHDAVGLCRNWDEFYELNVLSAWQYFPAANWAEWIGNRWREQMLALGFIMYFQSDKPDAMDLTVHHQTGSRGQSFRRSHAVFEARNFICAHIKRDDQVSRRLVQYISMQSHEVLVLVRDAETGKLLITPPEEERWLYREKSGLGRATKNDWNVIRSIGPKFFDEMEAHREWKFTFKAYYDVYIWDLGAGECFPHLYNIVQSMLVKAHRCRSGIDLYRPTEAILRTVYRDDTSYRPRLITPDNHGKVQSVWEDLEHKQTRFVFSQIDINPGSTKRIIQNEQPHRYHFYNDADALEDAVLFPEELSAEGIDPLKIGNIEPIKKWEDEGFSLADWAKGMDLVDTDDEDPSGSDDYEIISSSGDEWSDIGDDEPITPQEMATMQKMMRHMKRHPTSVGVATDHAGMTEEYMRFLEREKAKVFKEVWHNADLEPNAKAHYTEMLEMTKKSDRFSRTQLHFLSHPITVLSVDLMDDLDIDQRDVKTLHRASALVSPFFLQDFLTSKQGENFSGSLLFDQSKRAKNIPDCRSHLSNKYAPKDVWKKLDEYCKATKAGDDHLDTFPIEWDQTIRSIIAHLYKTGVLRTRSDVTYSGQAIASSEAWRERPDLYIDYRCLVDTFQMNPAMRDPYKVPSFRTLASEFQAKNPDARFSILRIWSAPHFYPLSIGWDNHDSTSFRDLIGRCFIWMFVPKDMPYSEWSMHYTARMRIDPYKNYFKDGVVAKRDKYLIMGKDEEDCRRLTTVATFAIQTRPWTREVDAWKSFFGVDVDFVQNLADYWLD